MDRLGEWRFDWGQEFATGHVVYALNVENDSGTQGLISVSLERDGGWCEVHLVESAPSNVGTGGRYKGVGAHLFAIACRLSLDAGMDGRVAFTAKTALVSHYASLLGAVQVGRSQRMVISPDAAKRLVAEYLDK
jgi:hypothetical protein